MIQFVDANGETVTVMALVTTVTVSASCKRGASGSFGSDEAFQSMTASIPPELPDDTIRQLAQDLYDECRLQVEQRVVALTGVGQQAQQPPRSALDEAFGTVDERKAAREAEKAQQTGGKTDIAPAAGGRVLTRAPKAEDRQMGDTWTSTVTHYKLTADKLELWGNGKYPEASLYPNSPAWPAETWTDRMVKDGSKQAFVKTVTVTQRVSDKKNDKGFYYVDVVLLAVAQAAVA